MEIAVVGGTGLAGSYVVDELRGQGHGVRVVSRRTGVDAFTGEGLEAALAGVDVVVDTSNTPSMRRSTAQEFFVTVTRRVQAAAAAKGVQHMVVLSILGIDRVRGLGYYAAKLAQERAAAAGAVPVTIVRTSQFHEFPVQLLARGRVGFLAAVPRIRSQPVAARTVGVHLARLAAERPGGIVELAGPEVTDIADLARRFVSARGERLCIVPIKPPGKAARDMRAGALLATAATILDGPTFDEWLRSPDAQRLSLTRAG